MWCLRRPESGGSVAGSGRRRTTSLSPRPLFGEDDGPVLVPPGARRPRCTHGPRYAPRCHHQKAQLDSRADAERAAVETLRTLGEHVSGGEAADLAEELPADLGDAVTSRTDETPDEFGPEEFAARIAGREGDDVDADDAMIHARAVMAAVAEHGGHNELQEAREQLPNEFATVFETDELATE